ncbi:hypothetical protein IC614_00100 [Allosphingosinicella flava]|uniref:Phosphatidate cytidylyltransferase n=1 Tax=Allosphingosinicella flava TaxID=2771430 RepID=A0A7T2GJL9_9SPHN|nr:hypothetical protein [Sphingosinicella flava]QPQ55070.1 hypothetical protein IC614_00100 [Sphingosinicella flava]
MSALLRDLVAAELAERVEPRVIAMAEKIAGRYPGAARAVLFYGSCLRTAVLDGLMLDFYVIVSDYRAAYGRTWLAAANRMIPPNVFPFEHGGLAAKYAVLSEADFHRETGPDARSVSVWARFAQPARLVWTRDEAARTQVIDSVAQAAPTLFRFTLPMMPESTALDPDTVWKRGFALTYGAELRAERTARPSNVVEADPARYERFGLAALAEIAGARPVSAAAMARRWRSMQRKGKWLSVLRLVKASGTFAGGIDYLAWKINRHAGTDIRIRPWHRKLPLIAALILLPRLLMGRAIR